MYLIIKSLDFIFFYKLNLYKLVSYIFTQKKNSTDTVQVKMTKWKSLTAYIFMGEYVHIIFLLIISIKIFF